MTNLIQVVAIGIAIALVAQVLWRRWRAAQRRAECDLASIQFEEQKAALPAKFLLAATATGRPRGLRWRTCDLHDDSLFARDRVTGELYALVGTTVSFEAIAGGDMEEVEAVGNLRWATAIFVYRQGEWSTDGQAVFNLEPAQALEHYRESLAPLA